VLDELYRLNPAAKKKVEGAAGYAVFSSRGMKLGIAGGGSGKGIAVDNADGAVTYMKMVEVQAGLGLGVKTFKLVWVFDDAAALKAFIDSGWELSGQSSAAAKAGSKGGSLSGAVSVSPGVWLYQIVGSGLALELTAKGTKYYKDSALN
jgi:lipid-binding SYLF domain-containing protein